MLLLCFVIFALIIIVLKTFKIAKQIPFNVLFKRIVKKLFPSSKINYSYKEYRNISSNLNFISLIVSNGISASYSSEMIDKYLLHNFNLLGSGYVPRKVINPSNIHATHKQFTRDLIELISKDYQYINWQLDIISNYEYKADQLFYKQLNEKPSNSDVKNCWELGRLQHLPQIAIAALNSNKSKDLVVEFKNQCLDFIAFNPVGMGIQWVCTMDVGIRVANMLIAYDIISKADNYGIINSNFTEIFIDSIYQHGKFIFNHLEQKEGAAGNHYLFNLVGLLFITNYLSESDELKKWRLFAEDELQKEFFKQFFEDGGNFEGSTTYHCLSAEAIIYGTALMLRRKKELSKDYISLLSKVYGFTKSVLKPNGEMPQFGDNDSGRLFKFSNEDDNLLNYDSFIESFSALFGNVEPTKINSPSAIIIKDIANNHGLPYQENEIKPKVSDFSYQEKNLKYTNTFKISFSDKIDVNNLKLFAFQEFGLFVFKNSNFYLAISSISNPKMHHSWGHVHNDKLSFELQVKGVDIVRDPGSYIYTSNPEQRNLFRSSKAHHSILIDGFEQNNAIDLFYLERQSVCNLLSFTQNSIELSVQYYGVLHIRKFEIFDDELVITDKCNKSFEININQFKEFSPNYGSKVRLE